MPILSALFVCSSLRKVPRIMLLSCILPARGFIRILIARSFFIGHGQRRRRKSKISCVGVAFTCGRTNTYLRSDEDASVEVVSSFFSCGKFAYGVWLCPRSCTSGHQFRFNCTSYTRKEQFLHSVHLYETFKITIHSEMRSIFALPFARVICTYFHQANTADPPRDLVTPSLILANV